MRRSADEIPTSKVARGHREWRFYSFGLYLGLANLLKNGFRLGMKKTIGKIAQPINSYTRFPEYFFMAQAICTRASASQKPRCLKILDIGSPKCFGLYLAYSLNVEITMTDISPSNLDEYMLMWESIRKQAKGSAQFALQDARALDYNDNQFDVVFSMSVLEHIEGPCGDSQGLREMVRVLRPGGLLSFSVPFGCTYVEQWRKGFVGAVLRTKQDDLYFFQRIYDRSTLEQRLLRSVQNVQLLSSHTVWRARTLPLRLYGKLGENLRALFGFMNPWLSLWLNRSAKGIVQDIPSAYGSGYSIADRYGDVVLVGEREYPEGVTHAVEPLDDLGRGAGPFDSLYGEDAEA